ncbi:MAG: hypothetical protein Phyf2KO_19350 [Phycisphaerales bacterium]
MRNKKQRLIKRLFILGTLLSVLIVTVFTLHIARTKGKERLLREHYEQGLAAYEAGDFELAVEKLSYYNSAINDDPDVAYKLADSSRRLPAQGNDHLRKAVLLAKSAADLAPTRAEPLELLLDLHGQLGQQTERMAVADRLLLLDENSANALTAKAMAQVALSQRDRALVTARKLAETTPDDPEAHRLVFAILASGDPATSRQQMADYAEKLGEDHPDDPRFVVLRVHAMALMGDLDAAREVARTMLDDDLSADTLEEAMRALDLLGLRSECDALLARHAQQPELFQTTALLSVKRAFMRGQIEQATDAARASLSSEQMPSADIIPWALACNIELSPENIDTLLEHSDPPVAYQRAMADGFLALRESKPLIAQQAFSRALSIRRDDPLAGAMLADVLDRIGAWKDAARQRRDVLLRAPEFTTVRLAYIESLLSRQRPIEADGAIREGLRIDPNNGALLLAHLLAVADMASAGKALPEELRGGIRVAEALEDGATELTPATVPLARMLIASGNQPELNRVLDRIVAADQSRLDLRALLALAKNMDEQQHPRSQQVYDIIDSSPRVDPYVLLERATSLADDGDANAGRQLIENKLTDAKNSGNPNAFQLEMARAAFLDRIADGTAIQTLTSLAETYTDNPSVQSLVLESRTAWSDPQLVSETITRLKSATGENATGWRIQDARRMLTFDPTEQNAAAVVTLLSGDSSASDPMSQLVLSDAMSILGDSGAAADHLERAIDAGFDNPVLILKLIAVRSSMGDVDAARRRAVSLAQIEPVSQTIRRERVSAFVRLGMFDTAESDGDVLATSDNPRDLIVAATLSAQLGDTDEANNRLNKLIALDNIPDTVLGVALMTLADVDRVQDAFALLESARTESPSVDFVLAEAALLERTGRPSEAVEILANAAQREPSTGLYTAQARLLARLGRADEAKAASDAGLALNANSQELILLREAIDLVDAPNSVNLTSGETDAARQVVEAIRRFSVEETDPQALIEQLRTITSESPTSYPGWSVLVTQLQAAGRLEEAAESAQTAMRLIPGDPRPARLTVDALLLINEPRGALSAAQEWSRRSKRSVDESYQAETTLAALHARLGSNTNAMRVLEPWADRIAEDQNASTVLVRLLATVRIIAGDENAAWELIAPRVNRDPRWLSSAIEISRDLLTRGGSAGAASSWLDRVSDEWNQDAEDVLRIAQARLDIASRTGSESDLLLVINTLDRLNAIPEKSDLLERGAALLRITAERQLGRRSEAARNARELAAARPGDSIALSMASLTTTESGGDAASAIATAQRAISLAEENPQGRFELTTALDALGQAQLAADLPADAEASFRRVLGLQRESASAKLGLAESLLAQDKANEAGRIARDPLLTQAVRTRPLLQARFNRLTDAIRRAG